MAARLLPWGRGCAEPATQHSRVDVQPAGQGAQLVGISSRFVGPLARHGDYQRHNAIIVGGGHRRRRSLASTITATAKTITAMVITSCVRVAKSGSIILVTFPQDHQFGRAVLRVAD